MENLDKYNKFIGYQLSKIHNNRYIKNAKNYHLLSPAHIDPAMVGCRAHVECSHCRNKIKSVKSIHICEIQITGGFDQQFSRQ